MTNQELFDRVVRHLAKQGKRSFDGKEQRCRYRMKRGGRTLKCAIGCLIPKRRYSPKIEGRSLLEMPNAKAITGLRADQLDLASVLQATHDLSADKNRLVHRLRMTADWFRLDDTVVGLITKWKV